MYSAKHSAARKRHPLRTRTIGVAIATTSTLGAGITLSPTAQAVTVWDRVAACESGGNWAVNTHNGYYGGLQFSAATWRAYGGTAYAATANLASKAAQIAIAQRVLAAQGPGAWPTCGRLAGLSRAGGAARVVTVSRSLARVAIVAHARLVVDGRLGPKTIRAVQRWVGTTQNGVLGSSTIKALQRKVGAYPDGVIGRRTIRALQFKIQVRRDGSGHLNARTVAALQSYLNRH